MFTNLKDGKIVDIFIETAYKNRGHPDFVFIRTSLEGISKAEKVVMQITGVTMEEMVSFRIISLAHGAESAQKYKYSDTEITVSKLEKFIQDAMDGNIEEYKRSFEAAAMANRIERGMNSENGNVFSKEVYRSTLLKTMDRPERTLLILTAPPLVCRTCFPFINQLPMKIALNENTFYLDIVKEEIDFLELPAPPVMMCFKKSANLYEYKPRPYDSTDTIRQWAMNCLDANANPHLFGEEL